MVGEERRVDQEKEGGDVWKVGAKKRSTVDQVRPGQSTGTNPPQYTKPRSTLDTVQVKRYKLNRLLKYHSSGHVEWPRWVTTLLPTTPINKYQIPYSRQEADHNYK